MRHQSYFNTAVTLITQYDGSIPLVHFLKQYFAQHKKHGSKDRKLITHLCYTFYRLGHALKNYSIEERLRAALFLSQQASPEWHILFEEEWVKLFAAKLSDRISFLENRYPDFSVNDIFPWQEELSDGIEPEDFVLSHLIQPDLFIRIRPGMEKPVLAKLENSGVAYKKITENCIALPNGTKIDAIINIDSEAVIQDHSSQRIAEFLNFSAADPAGTSVWDCCAASGGKSILAIDTLGDIRLTVSDIRPAILSNLKERFKNAGIKNYRSFVADISTETEIRNGKFELIICDAPCSGSGTWARTPEQLYFFEKERIHHFTALQKKIIHNVIPSLETGAYLLYITCSIFKKENEALLSSIEKEGELKLVKSALLKGYGRKADSMFAALFKNKN